MNAAGAPLGATGRALGPVLTGDGAQWLRDDGRRIVLTGAGGWLGLATLELLRNTLGASGFDARVRCFGSSARALRLRGGVEVRQQPLAALRSIGREPTIVLHNAFLTKDKAERMDDDAFVAGNRAIRDAVIGALDAIGAGALFVPSSGAARRRDDPDASPAMRLYGAMKFDDEKAFSAWAESRGAEAAIVRVFNLAGPYINKPEAYALASFILAAQAGRPIAVRAPRPVLRSYVAIRELMSIVFGLLTSANGAVTRFDTCGEETLELVDVARNVADVIAPVEVHRAELLAPGSDDYAGDRAAYAALLERFSVKPVPFAAQIRETADYLCAPA